MLHLIAAQDAPSHCLLSTARALHKACVFLSSCVNFQVNTCTVGVTGTRLGTFHCAMNRVWYSLILQCEPRVCQCNARRPSPSNQSLSILIVLGAACVFPRMHAPTENQAKINVHDLEFQDVCNDVSSRKVWNGDWSHATEFLWKVPCV